MQNKTMLIGVLLILALLLAACGGGAETAVTENEAAPDAAAVAENDGDDEAAAEEEAEAAAASESEAGEDAETAEATQEESDDAAEMSDEEMEETSEESDDAETADDAAPSGETIAGRPASGVDPDTGMQINPPELIQGEEFIVRGEIVSLNLTPQTEPEFLIEAPNGQNYRVRTQELAAITYDDGSTIEAYQFQQGMLAEATVYQDPGAGLTTVVESDDFRILQEE
jgi:hypothetical protein